MYFNETQKSYYLRIGFNLLISFFSALFAHFSLYKSSFSSLKSDLQNKAVVLAGCGAMDGSEIHESTLLLYAIQKAGAKYEIFAPNREQRDVMNIIEGSPMNEKRNVMVESARIARGKIRDLMELRASDFDALIIPGGFGAAKNLFTFAYDGLNFNVEKDIEAVVLNFNESKKPIGAMCIAPMMLASVLGSKHVEVTLGPKSELCCDVEDKFGAIVSVTGTSGVVVDEKNKVATTPAYMYGDNTILEVGRGAQNLVDAVLKMI
ncbi:MAG: isoprenoid biosynthesis glyoxalase ElbB [Rikenellaceae bacterium]